ncbi:ubiquinone biosynthesis regulatory protein kinase UbiB [Allohahella marinimesophila]|uniref:ubiquinone biosynthesis regulatory protein kinase UbiB n=1 Tax=Allohahella marinimesophila TaxID=1054972 RepID=UPI0031E25B60
MWRCLQILWVFSRYRLDRLIPREYCSRSLALILTLGPWRLFPTPPGNRGDAFQKALEELGPIFIKVGQLLSTRPDLLPPDIAIPLSRLQDEVAPFDGAVARAIIERQWQCPIESRVLDFSETPLASASIAQVHTARLPDGQDVVIKVTRPDIRVRIDRDTRLMALLADFVERRVDQGHRLNAPQVVADYRQTILDEMDMPREAANTSQLKRNFSAVADARLLYVPAVHWPLTGERVFTMERIHGIPISQVATLRSLDVNLKLLAERGVEIFFTQVFRDNFFHADMHPGNIFIDASKPEDPRYIAIDCGIVGSLTEEDQAYLAKNLLAFFRRDYRAVATLHVASGWVPADTPVSEFEAAIRTACEPIFERPLAEISFAHFLLRLFETARRFEMEVQPQLVLLQKTLVHIEGLGRTLYPELDLWQTAQPYLERWMKSRIGPPGLLQAMRERLPEWLEHSPEMPELVYNALQNIAGGSGVGGHLQYRERQEQSRSRRATAGRGAADGNGRTWPEKSKGNGRLSAKIIAVASIALLALSAGVAGFFVSNPPDWVVWIESRPWLVPAVLPLAVWAVICA